MAWYDPLKGFNAHLTHYYKNYIDAWVFNVQKKKIIHSESSVSFNLCVMK